jgi:hypothetical protein
MNIKSTNKLSALICVICGLIFLPLTLPAQNAIITTSTTESGTSYQGVADNAALNVSVEGVTYNGTNITLGNTFDNSYDTPFIPNGSGAFVSNGAILSLTDSTITTSGLLGNGVFLYDVGSGTLNNVNIGTTGENGRGVYARNFSTLTMTGGTITTNGYGAYGITSDDHSNVTVNNVVVNANGQSGLGLRVASFSTLVMTGGTIRNSDVLGLNAYGMDITGTSNVTLDHVKIETAGNGGHGAAAHSSTLTLTNSDITAAGAGSTYGIFADNSTVNVGLNGNTLSSGGLSILATGASTLTLTGSNGSVITGNVYSGDTATVNLTLTDTALHGNFSKYTAATINLTAGAGALIDGGGSVTSLTLQDGAILSSDDSGDLLLNGAAITVTTDLLALSGGAILDYDSGGTLTLTGNLAIGEGILVNFGGQAMEEGDQLLVINWSGAELSGEITVDSFEAADLAQGMTGTFTLDQETGLTFTAHAVPEPSTWFLLGTGLGALLLAAHYRRCRNARS